MKKIVYSTQNIFLYFLLFFLISCTGNTNNERLSQDSTRNEPINQQEIPFVKELVWKYDAAQDSLIKDENVENILTTDQVIAELNEMYPRASLRLVKTLNDTVFIRIDSVSFLQELGSTGNYGFISEVVFNITEVPNVENVNLDFELTDHATAGVYNRSKLNNKL